MKTGIVVILASALALAACEEAPADGTSEQPASEETATKAPADIVAPAERKPVATEAPGSPDLGYAGPIPMPIRIGTDGPDVDSCGSYGEVTGLNRDGDNYLSVRDAPSDKVKERDRIGAGHKVHVCAESNGWYGIVYDIEGDSGIDCEVDTPVDKPRNYTGPCAQGWVSKKFVKITAG